MNLWLLQSGVDDLMIDFDPSQMQLLNIILGIIMFGVALELDLSNFRKVFRNYGGIITGMTSQFILLPLYTVLFVQFLSVPTSLILGMFLVSTCPGGNVSNYFTHRGLGNTALSITMTTIVTLSCVVTTPFLFFIMCQITGNEATLETFQINVIDMMIILLQLVVIPLSLGLFVHGRFPEIAARLVKFIKPLSFLLLLGIIFVSLKDNLPIFKDYLVMIFWIVLFHNGLAYGLGYVWAKICGQTETNRRAISMETGIQNSGLALILILNFFDGLGGMVLVAGWWGVWDILSGFLLANYWNWKGLPAQNKI